MSELAAGTRLILGAIFLVAGASKVIHGRRFGLTLELSGAVPQRSQRIVRWALPPVELFAGGLLAWGGAPAQVGATIAGALLVAFILVVRRVLTRDVRVPCSCFGTAGAELDQGVIARDLVLLVYAVIVVVVPSDGVPTVSATFAAGGLSLLTLPFVVGETATLWVAARDLWNEQGRHAVWRPSVR
jgi:hypothetical protein